MASSILVGCVGNLSMKSVMTERLALPIGERIPAKGFPELPGNGLDGRTADKAPPGPVFEPGRVSENFPDGFIMSRAGPIPRVQGNLNPEEKFHLRRIGGNQTGEVPYLNR